MLDLCRGCHDRAHAKLTVFVLDGDEVTWFDKDTDEQYPLPMGARPLRLSPDETDEALATQWGEAQALGVTAIIKQAQIANEFRRRYGGFDGWWIRVADIIRTVTGLKMSVGLVYDRAALGIALDHWDGEPEDFLLELGAKSSAAVGRAIQKGAVPGDVIEYALGAVGGTTKTNAAKLIKRQYLGAPSEEASSCQTHSCRHCGIEWAIAPSAVLDSTP